MSAKAKTTRTRSSVKAFLDKAARGQRREDCEALIALMRSVTKAEPAMWGPSLVGFGSYHYVYESGREGDWPLAGFSPRKTDLTLYIMAGFEGYEDLLAKLGPHKHGRSCLYVKRLADLDQKVLKRLVESSVREVRRRYG